MSKAYLIFAAAPGVVSITSAGLQDLSTIYNSGTNGIVVNEISIVGINHTVLANGPVLFSAQIGFWDGATVTPPTAPWFFHSINYRNAAGVAGGLSDTFNVQRSFPSGLISPQGLPQICVDCTTFTNLSIFNFTLDLTYTPY